MPHIFQKFLKTAHNQKVNKTEVISRNTFFDSFYELESEKKSKKEEKVKVPFSKTARVFLTCLLIVRPRMPQICVFPDCFGSSNFWPQRTNTVKFPAFFQKHSKTVCILRVNKIKVTSTKAFIENVNELESGPV